VSAFTTSVEVSFESDELDFTNFGSGGWRQKITGLATGNISLTFNQDFAATTVDDRFGLGGTVGFVPGQVEVVGNTSLAGAYLAMLDCGALDEIARVAQRITIIELNLDPAFEERYIDNLALT
jgi:hypothetical protein